MSAFALAAQATGMAETIAAGIRAKANEQNAEVRLMAMTRPSWLRFVMAEVDRRAEVYAEAWRSRPEAPPLDETPRCAALYSVGDDVSRGRFG